MRLPPRWASHSQNLASLLVAEKKLVPAQKTVARRVEALVEGLPRRPGRLRDPRLHHAGPLEPVGGQRDVDEHERMVSEELAKLAREPVGVA